MSMEIFVLSDKQLNSVAEWQAAIDDEGYSLRLDEEKSINALKGYLPAHLRDRKTGFECGCWSPDTLKGFAPGVNFGHEWKFVLTFRWSGDLTQLEATWIAAAAYAQATDGVIFDEQDGMIKTPREALATARDIGAAVPKAEAILSEIKGSVLRTRR